VNRDEPLAEFCREVERKSGVVVSEGPAIAGEGDRSLERCDETPAGDAEGSFLLVCVGVEG
jgi:hypothetical protein